MKAAAEERAVVQRLLQAGMVLSVLLLLAGLLAASSHEQLVTRRVPLFTIGSSAREGHVGSAVAALGVLVLAATPLLRVLALACLWARERDFRFLGVSLSVAAILVFSLLSGLR